MTLLRRVLCSIFEHRLRYVWLHQFTNVGRECRRCGKRERKLGDSWLPAGKDWGWVD